MLLDLRRMGEMVAKILDAARLEQGRIELVPEEDVSSLRGLVRGIDTSLDRDEDRF